MDAQTRDKKISEIFAYCYEILACKGHDYAGDEDCLKNFRRFGSKGILVRMNDKIERLITLSESDQHVKDESVDDTAMDLINYAALFIVVRRDEEHTKVLEKIARELRGTGTEDYEGELLCEKKK